MNPLRAHETIAFNTSILVNRGALYLPPIISPARRGTHFKISLATPQHPSPKSRTQRLPHKPHSKSCLRTWHANTFLKDFRCG